MASPLAPLAPGIGRPPKHAGRLLSRVMDQNRLDRRTRVSKVLEGLATDLAAERGGWAAISTSEEILIRRAAFLTLLCSSIETWTLRQPDGVIVNGELLGPIRKGYATHQANLVRTLSALGIRPDAADKVPDLREYLERAASAAKGESAVENQPERASATHGVADASETDASETGGNVEAVSGAALRVNPGIEEDGQS